jgi:hypothetical protein
MSGETEFRGRVREVGGALHSMFGTGPAARAAIPELRPLPVTEPGFYRMTAPEYHADPAPEPSLSASLASSLVEKTPKHARLKHPRLNPMYEPDTAEHFDIGESVHAAFLEGRDVVEILEFDDFRKGDARKARDDARAVGKVPLLRKTWTDVELMLKESRAQLDVHEDGVDMFTNGIAEPVLVWREEGLWFRSRVDWLRVTRQGRFAIDDFKTTGKSADLDAVSKTAFDHGWDVKASFYRRGLFALTGLGAEFRFAVQECYPPFALSVTAPSPGAEMLGDMKVDIAISRWRAGVTQNEWRGYPKRTGYFEVPAWLESKWADRGVNDAV